MLLLHLGLPGPRLVHGPWRWLGILPIIGGVALTSRNAADQAPAIGAEGSFERFKQAR